MASFPHNVAPDPAEFRWNDGYLLGYGPMDDTHREFVDIAARLGRATDEEFSALLEEFRAHAQAHFDLENRWMNETDFPPRDCHIDEHAAVMKSLLQVQELVAKGNIRIGRDLVRELVKWFPGHAVHLDSALSHWMVKRIAGGKPLVFRKKEDILPSEPSQAAAK